MPLFLLIEKFYEHPFVNFAILLTLVGAFAILALFILLVILMVRKGRARSIDFDFGDDD